MRYLGTTYPNQLVASPPLLIGGSSQAAYWFPRIGFLYDGQTFEVVMKAQFAAPTLRLRIDGKLVTADLTATVTGLTVGTMYYLKCDLGVTSAGVLKLIEIDYNPSLMAFGGVVVEPTAVVDRGPAQTLRVAALTDSIGAGAGSPPTGFTRVGSWCGILAELFGQDVAMFNAGIGGTGWSVTAGASDYITRIPDIVAAEPDILFVEGEQNDGSTQGQLQTLATTCLAALVTALPQTLIFVIGSYSAGTPALIKVQHDVALRAACTTTGTNFISLIDANSALGGTSTPTWTATTPFYAGDVILNPTTGAPLTCVTTHTSTSSYDATKFRSTAIFFGTGKTGATTGDGNADFMVQSDGVHPTPRGCAVIARRIFRGTKAHLRRIAVS